MKELIINFTNNPDIPRNPKKSLSKRFIVDSNREYTNKCFNRLLKDLNEFGFICDERHFGKASSLGMVFLYKEMDELTKEYLNELDYVYSII